MSLKPKQAKALDALLDTGNVSDAAAAAGVTRQTVHEWMREPTFREAAAAVTEGGMLVLANRLASYVVDAAETVYDIMNDPSPGRGSMARLRAADIIMGRLKDIRELQVREMEIALADERLAALEAVVATRSRR